MRIKIASVFVFLAVATLPSMALADSLTRSSCWAVKYSNGGQRIICFLDSGRITMKNISNTSDDKNWSTCEFAGTYVKRGEAITIEVPARSGKCSNGPWSPNFHATCQFQGDVLTCDSSTVVDGQTYSGSYTFR